MVCHYIKPVLLSIVIGTILSGCAPKKGIHAQLEQPSFLEEEVIATTVPAELQPVPSEPETCLVQELDELRQTGSWVNTTEAESAKLSLESKYDFPVVINKQVEMYLKLFQNKQRKQLHRWISRSGKYYPMMEKELQQAGLPTDLAYLAMIESGYNQRAYSRAKAVGLWQFMKGTGRDYNLKVDRYVDERRDAEKSTKAAVAYLGVLHRQFGDWHLAVAAYNAGPGKIRYGLKKYKVKTFWELAEKKYLKLETKRYVPKLIAAIIISKDPHKYGFDNVKKQTPLTYETLEVGPGLSLDAISLISKSSTKDLQFLNQELKTGKTPLNRSTYSVKIPAGSYKIASQNLSRLHSVVSTRFKTHTIKKGESVSSICRKYKINRTTLLKVNTLRKGKLVAGTRLRIPHNIVKYQLLPENHKALIANKHNLILHKIRKGETVSKIAKKYNVPPALLVSWNGLKSVHTIRAGQQLALYIDNGKKTHTKTITASTMKRTVTTSSTIGSPPGNNTLVLADTKKNRPVTTSLTTFQWYKVKSGDSLWTISRKFKTSPKKIRQWNNLKSNRIHPGSRLKVKTA